MVELRLSLKVVGIAGLSKLLSRSYRSELYLCTTYRSAHALGSSIHIDAHLGALLRNEALKCASRGSNADDSLALLHLAIDLGLNKGTSEVSLCATIVIILGKAGLAIGIEVVDTECLINLSHVVVRMCKRHDSTSLHEHGLLPQGSIVAIDDATTLIVLTAEVVNPHTLGEVDAVTNVVALSVSCCSLIDRSDKVPGAEHILILCSLAQGVGILCIEEHGAHHRHAINSLTSDTVGIGHDY